MATTPEELIRSGVTRITGSDEQKAVDVQEVAGNNRILVESTRIVNDFVHAHLTITDTASILRVGTSNFTNRRGLFLQNNAGESTFSAIQDATITITAGNYEAQKAFDLALTDNVELSAKVVSGSLKDPVLNVFLMPRI